MKMKLHSVFVLIILSVAAAWKTDDGNKKIKNDSSEKKKLSAEEVVNVRIHSQHKITSFLFAPQKGNYHVIADGKPIYTLDIAGIIKVTLVDDSIDIRTFESSIGRCKSLKLISDDNHCGFKFRTLNPERKARYFDDNLSITIEDTYFKIINNTELDNYIGGVCEAESGVSSLIEFYKVQVILARTYALAHLYKHGAEGFNLCDQVHCQVFYGKTFNQNILQAVTETRGKVVVDQDLQLITAVFHSNSGGHTVNSEDVWGSKTSYLRSVNDSFSLKMPNARWERKMPAEDWLTYLKLRHKYPVEDSLAKNYALNFKQDYRKVNLEYGGVKVPLKNVRTDLQLKSTYFSIETKGDSILMRGRGFGHGIGMCQEGAMRMTKLGYTHQQVLNFYYQNIHLIDLKEMNFFREE
ncbi:MAG: SpoIID/LytB domain-containing protein [Bacteroidia bacterium]